MMPSQGTILDILGWMLLAGGVLAALFGLFADRSKGRRRCPKCWYDMSHTPGIRCSECGRAVKRERALFRTRRRWRIIVAGIGLFALSHFVFHFDEAREHGPVVYVPDWALVAVLPWFDEYTSNHTGLGFGSPPPQHHWSFAELHRRVESKTLSWLGWRLLIERCFAGDAKRPVHTPSWMNYGAFVYTAQEEGRLASASDRSRYMTRNVLFRVDRPQRVPHGFPVVISEDDFFLAIGLPKQTVTLTAASALDQTYTVRPDGYYPWLGSGNLISYNFPDFYEVLRFDADLVRNGAIDLQVSVRESEIDGSPSSEHPSSVDFRFQWEVEISGSIEDYLTIVDGSELHAFLERFGYVECDGARFMLHGFPEYVIDDGVPADAAIGWRISIFHGDEPIIEKYMHTVRYAPDDRWDGSFLFALDDDRIAEAWKAGEPGWTVHVCAEPWIALADHGATHAVIGGAVVPIRWKSETPVLLDDQDVASLKESVLSNLAAVVTEFEKDRWFVYIFDRTGSTYEVQMSRSVYWSHWTLEFLSDDDFVYGSIEYEWERFDPRRPCYYEIDRHDQPVDDLRKATRLRFRTIVSEEYDPNWPGNGECINDIEFTVPILPPDAELPWRWHPLVDDEE